MRKCFTCKCELTKRSQQKYCSVACQAAERKQKIKERIENGSKKERHQQYRTYMFSIHGESCMLCGWSQRNVVTNKVPLELDHIDGNSANNSLANLRLICPNCSSLQPTYKALNKGKGRYSRMKRYKAGKSY